MTRPPYDPSWTPAEYDEWVREGRDTFRAPGTDIEVEPYVADRFPVGWDVLAALVIAAACVAFIVWRWA